MKNLKQTGWFRSNPMLHNKKLLNYEQMVVSRSLMTVQGTINKTFLCLGLSLLSGLLVWWYYAPLLIEASQVSKEKLANAIKQMGPFRYWYLLLLFIFSLSIIAYTKPIWSVYLTPMYATVNGILLGVLSLAYESIWSGIIRQVLLATFIVLITVLSIYKTRLIRLGNYWRARIRTVVWSLSIFYTISLLFFFFRGTDGPFLVLFSGNPIGILFSTAVIVLLSFALLADLERANEVAQVGAPRYMEWYCAMGIMATIFWIYLEILRLMEKLKKR